MASTLATSGTDGVLIVTLASASRITSAAGCISAQWNGALTGSSTARRAPNFGASATARSIAVLGAGDHHLAGCIVVGSLRRLRPSAAALASSCACVEISAEQRRHCALADRHRLLHGATSGLEQPRGVGKAESARCCERRILAERMARHVSDAVLESARPWSRRTPCIAASDTAIKAGCAFSVRIELTLRPLPHQPRQILAERLIDLGEHCARGG